VSLWDEILTERALQDAEHGGPANDDTLTVGDWTALVTQFAGRCYGVARLGRMDLYRSRMIQVAAIAVAALESFDRQNQPPGVPFEALRAGPDHAPAPCVGGT
jgi:hypothetical protein